MLDRLWSLCRIVRTMKPLMQLVIPRTAECGIHIVSFCFSVSRWLKALYREKHTTRLMCANSIKHISSTMHHHAHLLYHFVSLYRNRLSSADSWHCNLLHHSIASNDNLERRPGLGFVTNWRRHLWCWQSLLVTACATDNSEECKTYCKTFERNLIDCGCVEPLRKEVAFSIAPSTGEHARRSSSLPWFQQKMWQRGEPCLQHGLRCVASPIWHLRPLQADFKKLQQKYDVDAENKIQVDESPKIRSSTPQ